MTTIRHKYDFDALIAMETGLSKKKVREITSTFLSKVMASIVDLEEVHLDGFGRFKIVAEKINRVLPLRAGYPNKKNPPKTKKQMVHVTRQFRVNFKKSTVFQRLLREKHGPSGKKVA